jgi:hypothetical protein
VRFSGTRVPPYEALRSALLIDRVALGPVALDFPSHLYSVAPRASPKLRYAMPLLNAAIWRPLRMAPDHIMPGY